MFFLAQIKNYNKSFPGHKNTFVYALKRQEMIANETLMKNYAVSEEKACD